MGKMKLELDTFELIIAKDLEYEVIKQINYLDLKTSKLLIIYENDSEAEDIAGIEPTENREKKNLVSTNSKRFLRLPVISHSEHHQILQDFLYSNWTDDKELQDKALWNYNSSIGKWLKNIKDDPAIRDAWYDYKRNFIEKNTINFFRKSIKELELPIIEENGEFYILTP